MHFTLLAAFLALSLRVSCARIQARQNTSPPTPLPPSDAQPATAPSKEMQVFNPVDMGQLCQNPAYYCIYVDQVRAGIVHASPVNATDNRKSSSSTPICLSPSPTPFDSPYSHILRFLFVWQREHSSLSVRHTRITRSTFASAALASTSISSPTLAA